VCVKGWPHGVCTAGVAGAGSGSGSGAQAATGRRGRGSVPQRWAGAGGFQSAIEKKVCWSGRGGGDGRRTGGRGGSAGLSTQSRGRVPIASGSGARASADRAGPRCTRVSPSGGGPTSIARRVLPSESAGSAPPLDDASPRAAAPWCTGAPCAQNPPLPCAGTRHAAAYGRWTWVMFATSSSAL